jgi:hypothetical protein
MTIRSKVFLSAPLLALAFLLNSVPASAALFNLVRENFNDVNGINAAGGARTVFDILATDPGQLAPGTTAEFSCCSPNVRRPDNEINTNAPNDGFNGFFDSKFLVLGDDFGQIGGNPSGAQEDTAIIFSFTIPTGVSSIRVSFDYAFDGRDESPTKTDHLAIAIFGAASPVVVQRFSSDTDLGIAGHFVGFFDVFTDLDPNIQDYRLRFRLNETGSGGGPTNTAAGIDNVRVAAVIPEPASALLLCAGLAGFVGMRRRAKPSSACR